MNMLGVTFIAVGKVIVAVLIGALTSKSIPHSGTTLRNFGVLISTLLLPCLTLSNTAKSVDLDMLIGCSALIFFSIILIACGLLWGIVLASLFFRLKSKHSGVPKELCKDLRLEVCYDKVAAGGAHADGAPRTAPTKKSCTTRSVPYVSMVLSEHFRDVGVDGSEVVNALEVPDEIQEEYAGYAYATWVGCSAQNGVTLPLSVLLNIASSVSFIDAAHCAAYIFVFAMSYMLYLWSACPAFVKAGQRAARKQRLLREILIKHKEMMGRCDAMTQTFSLPISEVVGGDEDAEWSEMDNPEGEAQSSGESRKGVNTLTRSPPASSAPSAGRTIYRDKGTSTLGVGDETAAGALNDKASHPVDSHTRLENPGRSLGNSLTRTDRSFVGACGRDSASGGKLKLSGSPVSMLPTATAERVYAMATAVQLPPDWVSTGLIRVRYESEMKALGKRTVSEKARQLGSALLGLTKKLMTSPPFLSVVVGIFIGIVPPLRGLFQGGPLEMVMDAITLIGEGSIPSSLMLLGANLVDSSTDAAGSAAGATARRLRHAEQNTVYPLHPKDWQLLGEGSAYARWYDAEHANIEFGLHKSFSPQTLIHDGRLPASMMMPRGARASSIVPMAEHNNIDDDDERIDSGKTGRKSFLFSVRRILSLQGTQPVFIWGIIVFRMLISPIFSFLLLMFLIHTMPFLFGGQGSLDKTLIMVLMVELATPTAINTTLLFNAYQFMTYPWAKMLFFQYILCTVSVVMWASIGLSYVSSL
ncbi:hypothetical protein JKF63_05288 [Porcisia hertigi]|uniref:PIN-like protein n=1 Tax=Porcisia hertigi TaxID=2761500 RepID=A0A836LE79_9TRYP|nr:hypothetical protein JKF63_05288 [Porcisia hertigi]